VRRPPVHSLLVAPLRGALDLPENVSAEETHLVLELAQACLSRIGGIAKSPYGADILRLHRGGIVENLNGASALAWALGRPAAMSHVRGEMRSAKCVLTETPGYVAALRTDGVEQLPLARLAARHAVERRQTEVVDGYRRLARKRPDGATRLASWVTRACTGARGRENPEEPKLLLHAYCAAKATR
jgi:hypothetical protein